MFRDLPTPVTIGREDDNTVRLNDERVSRFHAKMQEDGGTGDPHRSGKHKRHTHQRPSDSNARPANRRPDRDWPVPACVREPRRSTAKVEAMLNSGRAAGDTDSHTSSDPSLSRDKPAIQTVKSIPRRSRKPRKINRANSSPKAPRFPRGLRPLQRAQVSDLLGYCHEQIRRILQSATQENENGQAMRVAWQEWQRLLRLEMELAATMKKVADPDA